MKIFITGGTGFVGGHLCRFLTKKGYELIVLSRSSASHQEKGVEFVGGNPTEPGNWQKVMKECDAVINLAGFSVFRPWTRTNRRLIMDSRILTTRNIATALKDPDSKVKVLVSGSAVGYYGDKGDLEIHEGTPPGSDFLATVAESWENEARGAADSVRVVRCRLGIVLGPDGGALEKMVPPFRRGLGAPLGSGRQWFSWIHIDDLVEAFSFVLQNDDVAGAVNFTSPRPVTNRDLSRKLAHALGKPFFMPSVPKFLLKVVMGDASSMILDSIKVLPGVLQDKGFSFKFPDLDTALEDLIARISNS